MASTIQIINAPSSTPAGQATSFSFEIDLENKTNVSEPASVRITVQLVVNGDPVDSASAEGTENDTVKGTLSHTFEENTGSNQYPRKDETALVKADLDYYFPGSTEIDVSDVAQQDRDLNGPGDPYTVKSSSVSVDVTKPEAEEGEVISVGDGAEVARGPLTRTFDTKTPFSIKEISYPQNLGTRSEPPNISFGKYTNPTIAIDTSGRFAKHEIIGGTTVRQKIGEDPINVSINGVCKPQTAQNIDKLRNATSGKIFSDRLPGGSLVVQFGSTSTEPLDDGGAADIEDGQFLYTFQMNCIEVRR
jgi:hypothetical protein